MNNYRDDFKIDIRERDVPFIPRTRQNVAGVGEVILFNQQHAPDWANRDWVTKLRKMSLDLITGLKIRVKDSSLLAVPTFRVGEMNIKTVGRYHADRDDYAISETISINRKRVELMKDGEIATHLLMLLLCAWRHQTGGTGRFDLIARNKLRSFGLKPGKKGVEEIDRCGTFATVLSERGIGDPPDITAPAGADMGGSSNRLYSCNCQRARVGTKLFFADCPKCGRPFELGDHVGKFPVAPLD